MSLAVANIWESWPFVLQRMARPDMWFRRKSDTRPRVPSPVHQDWAVSETYLTWAKHLNPFYFLCIMKKLN